MKFIGQRKGLALYTKTQLEAACRSAYEAMERLEGRAPVDWDEAEPSEKMKGTVLALTVLFAVNLKIDAVASMEQMDWSM